TTLQAAPSQWMASVLWQHACPTAHTSLDVTAATPNRMLSSVLSLGLGTTLQAEPFQCKVNVRASCWDLPTAQTSFEAIASAPNRTSSLTPGVATILQVAPFQCIAIV